MHLIPHESPQTRQLHYEITALLQQLETIEQDITAFHHALYAFEREYQQRLGDLAEAVVVLRAQLGMTEALNNTPTAITHLVDEDAKRLKRAFRQAAKWCHPDQLPAAQREAGLLLFDALHKAYHLQDIVQVEHILWLLESGQAFSDTPVVLVGKDLLARRKVLLEQMIVQQIDHLAQLKMREDYDVSNRDNWNILLYDYQTQLEDELAMLRGRAASQNGD